MCGRYTITTDQIDFVLKRFTAELAPGFEGHKPRYNVSPGQFVPAIVAKDNGKRYLTNMFWGFVPVWGEKPDGTLDYQINIRDDTIAKNKFFATHLQHQRCAFIVDSFYEWKNPPGFEQLERGKKLPKGMKKIPHRIFLKDKQPFALAGLWRTIKTQEQTIISAGIITTSPNEFMSSIHSRMPAILSLNELDTWFDTSMQDFSTVHKLLKPYDNKEMEAYVVNDYVNRPGFDAPACIEPAV